VFWKILTYVLEAIAVYGFVSFFGLFFKGGRIIDGIVTSVIVLMIENGVSVNGCFYR